MTKREESEELYLFRRKWICEIKRKSAIKMSDDEVMRFEINDQDIDDALNFGSKRPRQSKNRATYGIWAEDSDEEEVEVNAEPSTSTSVQDPNFKVPKPKCRKFIFKPFKRTSDGLEHDESKDPVEVIIPEQLAASYGLYLWPSAPVLAWYLWLRQDEFQGKQVLELGSGTALPGLLTAKIGADQVTLSDDAWQVNTIKNILEAVKINHLQEPKVQVKGLTWGDYTEELFELTNLDFIIGSDLFFDPEVFEPLLITIAWLLEHNPKAEVLIAVQERSSDWCLEEYLLKWKLKCSYIYPKDFLQGTGLEETDLTGKHTIFILKIFPE